MPETYDVLSSTQPSTHRKTTPHTTHMNTQKRLNQIDYDLIEQRMEIFHALGGPLSILMQCVACQRMLKRKGTLHYQYWIYTRRSEMQHHAASS